MQECDLALQVEGFNGMHWKSGNEKRGLEVHLLHSQFCVAF